MIGTPTHFLVTIYRIKNRIINHYHTFKGIKVNFKQCQLEEFNISFSHDESPETDVLLP